MIHLQAHGVSVVLDATGDALPRVLHWGPALGDIADEALAAIVPAVNRQTPPGTLDAAWQANLFPQESDGFSGRPGLSVRLDGTAYEPRWAVVSTTAEPDSVRLTAEDAASGLALEHALSIEAGGVVWAQTSLHHRGAPDAAPVEVDWLEQTLPVSQAVDSLLTFDGRWPREKRPVVTAMPAGSTVRQSRRGRPGHDAPTAFVASIGAPRWQSGRVYETHVAWPSDVTYRVDRITDQVPSIGGGELLRAGEVVLGPGTSYTSPRVAFVFSDHGLDGAAARVHTWLRARPQHPATPRPLTLNTWEAVYFDHDPERVAALARRAGELGIERFVLDDGWFLRRRSDDAGLGDWVVDRTVWPDGLGPLADLVHGLGMQFGLWFEPEMVSVASDVFEAHPGWILHDPRHLDHDPAVSWRTQYVLDLANPDAYAHVRDQISALVAELGIDYIKWDHNRDLVESRHESRPGVHVQTLAVLRLMAELKDRHPGLEIESCSSGGARTDLGIMQVADRVWASDSNDPVERQDIQRWTSLLLPPELVGAHVGPVTAHSSGRTTDLSYRMATSLAGSAGFEWNLLECDESDAAAIRAFAALYRELRPVIHGGAVHHPDLRDPAWRVNVFSTEASAVAIVATVASVEDARPERLRMPGLRPDADYRVRVRDEIGAAKMGWIVPEWFGADLVLPGRVLAEVGLQLPALWPQQAFVLHLTEV